MGKVPRSLELKCLRTFTTSRDAEAKISTWGITPPDTHSMGRLTPPGWRSRFKDPEIIRPR
tara:strand:- start:59 stop:241 length:183 start_codon:yes stop_codon:yes gene_type:complete